MHGLHLLAHHLHVFHHFCVTGGAVQLLRFVNRAVHLLEPLLMLVLRSGTSRLSMGNRCGEGQYGDEREKYVRFHRKILLGDWVLTGWIEL